jgi:hypothetical protein
MRCPALPSQKQSRMRLAGASSAGGPAVEYLLEVPANAVVRMEIIR